MAEKFSTGHVNMLAEAARTAYANCVIGVFNGVQPTTSNDSEGSAELLGLVTLNAGVFTPGQPTNGLNFSAAVDGVLSKAPGEIWKLVGLPAAGSSGKNATWFRVYTNAYVTGASSSALRWDGSISTASSAELRMTNPVIVEGVETTISSFTYTFPRVG